MIHHGATRDTTDPDAFECDHHQIEPPRRPLFGWRSTRPDSMQHDHILDTVARRADLESPDVAEGATVATLETLGEHLSAGEAEQIAAELPDDLAVSVVARSDETPEEFSLDEFVERVRKREGVDVDDAEAMVHARAVMAALVDAGLSNELREAREQLPNEYASIFETADLAE